MIPNTLILSISYIWFVLGARNIQFQLEMTVFALFSIDPFLVQNHVSINTGYFCDLQISSIFTIFWRLKWQLLFLHFFNSLFQHAPWNICLCIYNTQHCRNCQRFCLPFFLKYEFSDLEEFSDNLCLSFICF